MTAPSRVGVEDGSIDLLNTSNPSFDTNCDLCELAGRLADVTGNDTYTRVLGDRDITSY